MTRKQCTKENPYTPERDATEAGYGWKHTDAHEVGEQENGWPGDDIVKMRCDNCGLSWKSELPQ